MRAADREEVPISVVISTRNRSDALARCLERLAAGTLQPAEIVVVDQGDHDPAEAVVERFAARGAPIRYLPQPPRGLGAAQNTGVRAAASPWIAVTDDDCLPDPGWLEVIAQHAATGRYDVLTGRVLAAPPVGDRTMPVSTRTDPLPHDFHGKSAPWHVGSGNNFALRRELYLEIGGCDERLGPGSPAQGGVDMDLFYRLLRAGARIRYEPQAVVRHERQSPADRQARRPMYGYGMGACFGIWLRQRDLFAFPLMAQWLALRAARTVRPRDVGRIQAVREELTILLGTARGIAHGLRAPAP